MSESTAVATESVPVGPVSAPDGASFEYDEVKTDRGQKSLGQVPLLVWQDLDKAIAYYGGNDNILGILDGTSLRVSFQGIARRLKAAGKSDNEIMKAQVDFKPGKRQTGQSTPTSRAAAAAKKAAGKLNGDVLAQLIEKMAAGQVSDDQLRAFGIDPAALHAVSGNGEVVEEEAEDEVETVDELTA